MSASVQLIDDITLFIEQSSSTTYVSFSCCIVGTLTKKEIDVDDESAATCFVDYDCQTGLREIVKYA